MKLRAAFLGLCAVISSTSFATAVDDFAQMIKIPELPNQRMLYFPSSCFFSLSSKGTLDLGNGISAEGFNVDVEQRASAESGGEVTLDLQWIPVTEGSVSIAGQAYTNQVSVKSVDNGAFLSSTSYGFRKTGWFEKDRLVLYSLEIQLSPDLGHVIELRASTSSKAIGDDQGQWVGEQSFICD